MMQRCYDILDLPTGATFDDAKRAYRDLASVWHPDRVSAKNPRLQKKAEERLKEINSAYQLLSSHVKSTGQMPFPSHTGEAPESGGNPKPPGPDVASWPRRRFPVVLFLVTVVMAAAGFHYYHSLLRIDMGHSVARERLELSDTQTRELIKNLPVTAPTETAPVVPAPKAAETPHPVTKMTVNMPERGSRGETGIHTGPGGDARGGNEQVAVIDKLIEQAESLLAAGHYPESRAAYESALALVSETDAQPAAGLRARKTMIDIGMARDEIVYGGRGYVHYRNRWVPPDIYRKEFVTYRDQRRHFKEMIGPLSRAIDPEVNATLMRRYPGQVIHKKVVTCLDLELIENSSLSARFRATYQWEVWTFNAQDTGRLVVAVRYLPKSDQWRIGEIVDQ
ncbi:hypothetical protein D3OALGA1CA_3431 [Olavius algarvensis associated proteobacterium Delta 3]|nr:hypothetical protein D3OALGA1CA_3431 [Olavius algarvensis associated proteobacterium Delta 3]CAB5162706.1 hypothetical protein D3OALGB2SA_5532 [Olavius algarvensis associated proteobacterium Delta 3]